MNLIIKAKITLLEQLKEATKLHHSSVEKVLVSKFKNLKSTDEYAELLTKLYTFYYSVEQKVHQQIDESVLPDIKSRLHVHNLKNDLKNLGISANVIDNPFSSKINSLSYAFGVMYVMEGSTLGGQVITTMLKKQLPAIDNNALTYFSSYGENTFKMWSIYKSNFENIQTQINEQELISGATDTFKSLREWLLDY